MTPATMVVDEAVSTALAPNASRSALRVRPVMRQGNGLQHSRHLGTLGTIEAARAAVKHPYHDDRVLRMFIVTDDVPPRFVEWVER